MKKKFLILLFISITTFIHAQVLQNAGFENWSNITFYTDPDGFFTTNQQAYFTTGAAVVTQNLTPHAGSYAAQLSSSISGTQLIPGLLLIGTPANGTIVGGYPYSQRPDSLVFYEKHSIINSDTASVIVLFKKLSNVIGFARVDLTGNANNYVRRSASITFLFPVNPDTMAFIASSSLINNGSVGSTMILDDVSLVGANQSFPNGGFENWTSVTSEEPDMWTSSNVFTIPNGNTSVAKSSNSNSGNFSCKITTQPGPNQNFGFIMDGYFDAQGNVAGGLQVQTLPSKLKGYYRYIPSGTDTGSAIAFFTKWNSSTSVSDSVAEFYYPFMPASSWTYFELGSLYNLTPFPDSVIIAFSSSNLGSTTSQVGSQLFIDDASIELLTGVEVPMSNLFHSMVSPNPADRNCTLSFSSTINNTATLKIFSMSGELISSEKIKIAAGKNEFQIPVTELSNGNYFIEVSDNANSFRTRLTVQH